MKRFGHRHAADQFPLALLRIYGREEAAARNRAARLTGRLEQAARAAGPAIEDLLGAPVSFALLAPGGERVRRGGEALAASRCAVLRIESPDGGFEVFLAVPARLLEKVLARMFSFERLERPPDAALLEMLASFVALEALASCGPAQGPLLRLVSVAQLESLAPLAGAQDEPMLAWNVRATIGKQGDMVTVLVPERDAGAVAEAGGAAAPDDGPMPARVGGLEVAARLICATCALTAGEAAALAEGDVLFPDFVGPAAPEQGRWAALLAADDGGPPIALARCVVDRSGIAVQKVMARGEERIMAHEGEDRDGTEGTGRTAADGSSMPGAVGTVPVDVAVEVGRLRMTVAEIASLVPGSVLGVGRPVSAEVTLTSGGRTLAHGMLVSVEGELGVQVIKVA